MFQHEYKASNIKVYLNTQRRHTFGSSFVAVFTAAQLLNNFTSNTFNYVNENADEFLHALMVANSTEFKPDFSGYFDNAIGSAVFDKENVAKHSFVHDGSQPNIIIGTTDFDKAVNRSKVTHRISETKSEDFYFYELKGSNNAQQNPTYYFKGSKNILLQNYPHLAITNDEANVFENNITPAFFNPRLVIHSPYPSPFTPEYMENEYKQSYGLGYFFNLRSYIPLVGSNASHIQAIVSIGKLNSMFYGNSYYSFVILSNGKIRVIQSTRKPDGTYNHKFVRNLEISSFKVNNEVVGAFSCCVFMYKDDLYVIFSTLDNILRSAIDTVSSAVTNIFNSKEKDVEKISFSKGNDYTVYKISKYERVTSIDATIYAQDDANLMFNGFPLTFKPEFRFVFDASLPITNMPNDFWYKSHFGIQIEKNNRKYVIKFGNDGYAYDGYNNVAYILRIYRYNEETKTFEEINSTKGGRLLFVISGTSGSLNPFVLKGFDDFVVQKPQTVQDVYYSTNYGEFPTRFIRSITINRGHYNDENTCVIEFFVDKRHPLWNTTYENMLKSNVISVDIYAGNRLIFSGVTPIDNFKENAIDVSGKIETMRVTFEEDWLRRLKENSVILPENLYVHGSHSRALKYILTQKIGLNDADMVFADDNIPLPLTTELSQESEYTMIMGRDYYSYVDNIVSNFSGWTLYRNYALNDDNTNSVKLVYKPKPMFVNVSLVRCYFYSNQQSYNSSQQTYKAKIVGGIKIEYKRPFATALAIIRPVYNDVKSIISEVIYRNDIVEDINQPDYIGFPIVHYILYPMAFDVNSDKNDIDIFKREIAIRYLYGHRVARFRANFMPHLHYYSHVYIENVGYGVIKNMTVYISSEGVFCDYTVTLETGGLMYQW